VAILVSTQTLGKAYKNALKHVHSCVWEAYPNGSKNILTFCESEFWSRETGSKLIACDGWQAVQFEEESDFLMFCFKWS